MGAVALWALAKRLWPVAAVLVVLLALWLWHTHAVDRAYARGSDAQVAADGRAVTRAFVAANAAQDRTIAALTAKQDTISKGTADATVTTDAAIARALADWRMRHPASAAAGRAIAGAATAIPDAAGSDHAADEADAGTVSVDPQVIADAASDAAQAMACSAWVRDQAAAWPK